MEKKYADDFIEELVSFHRKALGNIREIRLSRNRDNISHQHIVPFGTYSPWVDHALFRETYEAVKANTLVDIYRCFELWSLVERNCSVDGDILEVGVWRGGTGCLLAKSARLYCAGARVYLADTFKGVVKASARDTRYKGGEHADTTVATVKQLINDLALDNIELMQGVFPDDINFSERQDLRFRLCHIDVDTYSSAKDVFDYIWPRMSRGGTVVFDDYGCWGCDGVTELCNGISLSDAVFVHNLNGHALFIKL